MAETNNFALKGVANLVQFGKRGLKILTDTDNDYEFRYPMLLLNFLKSIPAALVN